MSQGDTDCSAVLGTASSHIDRMVLKTFVSLKGKHVSKLAWGPWAGEWWVPAGWFALEAFNTSLSVLVS